jgi:hypothetical protein
MRLPASSKLTFSFTINDPLAGWRVLAALGAAESGRKQKAGRNPTWPDALSRRWGALTPSRHPNSLSPALAGLFFI